MNKTPLISLAACALLALPAQGQNLLVNGSFEEGNFTGNGLQQLLVGSTVMPGWTVITDEIAWIVSGNVLITASEGSMCLDLTGFTDVVPHGGVTQVAPTTMGQPYRLTFDLGTNPDSYPGPMTVTASAGAISRSFVHDPQTGSGTQWSTYGFEFTAESAATPITISAVSGGLLVGLDNVALVAISGPDTDGDGVPDDADECPGTADGAIVDSHGCSIRQLVPCAGPLPGQTWKNHGQYVSSLAKAANAFVANGLITENQAEAIVSAGARSRCGMKPVRNRSVLINRSNRVISDE